MEYLGMIGPFQLILIYIVVGILPTIIALIDILKSNFKGNDKIIWLLVVIFLNIFGAFLYFFIGRRQKLKE